MDEDVLNLQLRKFLKKVGITSQREIERAVRAAHEAGRLEGKTSVTATVRIASKELDLSIDIDDTIALE